MGSSSELPPPSTTDERWHRVDQLLQSALEREPSQRAAFLREACAGDESLFREVESLLLSHKQAGDFLERPSIVALKRFGGERAGLLIGRRIGPYELLSLLGSGGMGEVYRATDTRLKRYVAIKLLSADSSLDEKRLQYFEREARLASALNHPNIVTIYDIGRSDFGPYIAMELVEGKTLRDALAEGLLPLKRVLHVAAQVADGLAKAHAVGIFHRDLKPENLMITRDGLVKILDFGLAKVVPTATPEDAQVAGDSSASKRGVILGTVGYMSPEQARGDAVDFRADQFSLGTILYEMLTGTRAFQGATAVETLSAIIRGEPASVGTVNPNVPVYLRWIVERCLAKDVAGRYASTSDLARDLDNLRNHLSSVASWDISGSVSARVSRTTRRFRVFVGAALATVVLVAAIALRQNSSANPVFHQISFGHGSVMGARFGADGRSVIYTASWVGETPALYATQPGNPESRPLGVSNAGIWAVSSSGEMAIAYPCTLNWGECIGTLALVPPAGGMPHEELENVTAADWMPDGKTLVAAQFVGGKARIIQHPSEKVLYETAGWVGLIRVSPKGDRIAFLDYPILGEMSGSVSILDQSGKKTVLSSGWKVLFGLAWSPNGDQVWFTGSRESKGPGLNLFAVTLSGTERPVYSLPGTMRILDISPDGRRFLVRAGGPRAVLIGLGPGDSKERELSWFDFSTVADLSSDGKTLIFYEWGLAVAGNETAYLRKTDGSDAKRLGEGKPLALSPDGQLVLALQHPASQQLVLLPTGLGKPKPLPRGGISEFLHWAAWSPRGERIFFTAAESGHRPRTWVQDLDGGLPRPVTPEGISGILLSPDGRLIAAVDHYQQYYLYPVSGRTPTALEGYEEGDVLLQWSDDGRAIFLRSAEESELKIYRLDVQTGTRRLWKELRPPNAAGSLGIGTDPGQVRITPDGQFYVYTAWMQEGQFYVAEGLH